MRLFFESLRLIPGLRSIAVAMAVLLGGVSAESQADDLDIYTSTTALPRQQPLTFLALDLNLTNGQDVVCENVLLSTTQNCTDIRSKITVNDLLMSLGIPLPTGVPNGAPTLPLVDPNVPLSDLNATTQLLVNSYIGAITAFYSTLPTQPAVDPLEIDQQTAYVLAIINLVQNFALSRARLAIFLNHADKGSVTTRTSTDTTPPTVTITTTPGSTCAFQDTSSLGGERGNTTGCSNGAYLFLGLADLVNPVELLAAVDRIVKALLPPIALPIDPANPSTPPNPTAPSPPQLASGFAADHPYQTKEIYVELAKVLRGDKVFNGHLGYFDYGDNTASNNVNQTTPPLAWDTSAEAGGSYKSAIAAFPQACTINLVHLQNTNAQRQEESNTALATLFPFADEDSNGQITVPELAESAGTDGFVYATNDRRLINSLFVMQETLTDVTALNQRGQSVVGFTDALNLLGRGEDIAAGLVKSLAVDASIGSISMASSRSSANGRTGAAYLPVFRPDKDKRPAWVGNVKRLRLAETTLTSTTNGISKETDTLVLRDANGSEAVAADGRIRPGAVTFWTDITKLGNLKTDGRRADLGGAGQNIPGYRFNGGGNPGRGNPVSPSSTSTRSLFYDSTSSGLLAKALNPDDAAVRTELTAATGATAVTLADPNCASNCQDSYNQCDTGCTNNTFLTECTAEQSACTTACGTSGNYLAQCETERLSCRAACPAGLGGTLCRSECETTNLTCAANKLLQCTTACPLQAATCPDRLRGDCRTNCLATLASCRVNCSITRTADTITRELLLYARGFDVGTTASPKGDGPANSRTNTGVTGRPWMMGAVLHSQPLAINYGARNGGAAEDVRVVFGSSDGVLHMVDDRTGLENWGFMPQAVMNQLATLRDNQSGAPLPYGVDGTPVVLIRDRATAATATTPSRTGVIGDVLGDDGDRVLLFFGLRRGGAAYYALNVTNPDAAPVLQWRITPEGLFNRNSTTVVSGSAAQFSRLALSFSTPQLGRIRYDHDNNAATAPVTQSVLIFGGGYNGGRNGSSRIGKDANNSRALDNAVTTADERVGANDVNRGNAVFMVNAETGELIWRANDSATAAASYDPASSSYAHPLMDDSIAADLTVLDTNNDGYIDRLYGGDTGGRLWRADFPGVLRSAWTITPLASVGRHNFDGMTTTAPLSDDRRLFFAPDYIPVRPSANAFNAGSRGVDIILFGTGDREDPLNTTTENWVYGFRDTDIISGKTASEILVTETALAEHGEFNDTTLAANATTDITALPVGYRFRLPRRGEKIFSTPLTLNGVSTFSSFIPADPTATGSSVCVPSEGGSRLFAIDLRKSSKRGINNAEPDGRDTLLAAPGLPGGVGALSPGTQNVGAQNFTLDARTKYRASWRERLGESEKAVTQTNP